MLILLLVYAITQSGFGEALPMPSIETRDPAGGSEPIPTRSIWNIIWSCLSTIFLCTWVSLHPNISSTPEKSGISWFERWLRNPLVNFLTYNLPLFLWALLVPEYILAWAIRQYITAGRVQKQVPGWTRTHGFFLTMGGFQLLERNTQPLQSDTGESHHSALHHNLLEPGKFVRILGLDDMQQHQLEIIVPFITEEELKDRGKSDGISKAIVLLQTVWFVIQCIARGIEHLPLTELEIVTLAYAMMNFFIYIFWWNKPRDVGCPIRVYENLTTIPRKADEWEGGLNGVLDRIFYHVLGAQDSYVQLDQECKVPMFWSGGEAGHVLPAALGPSILGMGFGAIHFIAWSYIFPSYVELVLWHSSCIAMLAVPFLSTFICGWAVGARYTRFYWVLSPFIVLLALSAWLYIVARIATMVLAFTTLRSLPSEAFRVVDWTTFIPHI